MKIKLIQVGKTDESWLREGISIYEKRLAHYISFSVLTLAAPRYPMGQRFPEMLKKESEKILSALDGKDHVVLCDEKGNQYTSLEFAQMIRVSMDRTEIQSLVFVIGGPFGFGNEVYKRSNGLVSFSSLTFSHQMVRLFFAEQLYRAFTILKGEPYHHK